MSKEILYLLLPEYADHEAAYLTQAIASDELSIKECGVLKNIDGSEGLRL